MRSFILLAALASVTTAYAFPKGLQNGQDPFPRHDGIAQCSVDCLSNSNATVGCIPRGGFDSQSDLTRCICSEYGGASACAYLPETIGTYDSIRAT
ncbi:hypothetical protein GY45DRAFT_1328428 [Cubamyces sp. BRFM 1775]|nr:hypothetical protein GY45DRAFT_1328428 [Cubamyces sp. BRFM 1775]